MVWCNEEDDEFVSFQKSNSQSFKTKEKLPGAVSALSNYSDPFGSF